jgi:arylsulfatase A-like enzyme/tetratricopeptide (TPR) repeat protein
MLFALILQFGCTTQPPEAVAARPSIILVTLDTTRQDRLGAYGYAQAGTDTIDKLAREGIRFDHAYATVPLTTPSHASMLTGLYPSKHGIRSNGDAILSDELTTLAESLQSSGYRTAASVSAFVTTAVWKLDQGFDVYFDEISQQKNGKQRWAQERPAEDVVDDLVPWLGENNEQPFFLWAHFYDPHHPHEAEEPYRSQYSILYDAEIAYVDDQIERLRIAAEEAAGPGGVAWLIVADHGESFGAHGERGHGMFIWNTTMQIPFILRPPQPLEVPIADSETMVSGVDVMPTLLSFAGATPSSDIDGVDLSPLLRGEEIDHGPVYLEASQAKTRFGYHPEIAAISSGQKYFDTPSPHLYDLNLDPQEKNNLMKTGEQTVEPMKGFAQEIWNAEGIRQEAQLSTEVVDQLSALGYMSSDFSGQENSTIDAKDRVETIAKIEAIREARREGANLAKLAQAYREILEKEPQIAEARLGLAGILGIMGKSEEALVVYGEALQLEPRSSVLRMNMATAYAELGRFEEGIALLADLLSQVPGDSLAQSAMLRMLIDTKQLDEALIRGREWLQETPNNYELQGLVGIAMLRANQPRIAQELLMSSLQDETPRQYVQESLGLIFVRKNRIPEAIVRYKLENDTFPDPKHHITLGNLYLRNGDYEEAAAEYSTALEKMGESPKVRLNYAQSIFNAGDYERAKEALAPAYKASPNDAGIVLLQANIVAKLGDMEEGKKLFERAKSLKAEDSQK